MEQSGASHDQGTMHDHAAPTGSVQLPAPTAWPMVLGLGISLMLAGLLTHWAISLLGLLMTVLAIVGWFFEVLPEEHHVYVDVHTDVVEIKSTRETLAHLPIDERHRKLLPVETFSLMSGVKGGIAGGVAMVVPAALYSFIRYHSVWYAANLLAAGGFVSWAGESNEFLAQFHLRGLLAALGIHALTSVLIGLLYGAMLPMFPRWPILTAGFIAPFLWTGILRSALERCHLLFGPAFTAWKRTRIRLHEIGIPIVDLFLRSGNGGACAGWLQRRSWPAWAWARGAAAG